VTPGRREETPVRSTQLRLELTSESWVEVYDSRGERLYYDVASAGSVQSIEGRPPLRVVLGNAAAVAVQVNGESREIPSGAAEGEGARFVVNRSGTLSRARQ
jgi:cytoskeleton protein RodZ